MKPEELGLPSILVRPETPYNPKDPDREDRPFFENPHLSPRNASEKIKKLVDVDAYGKAGV